MAKTSLLSSIRRRRSAPAHRDDQHHVRRLRAASGWHVHGRRAQGLECPGATVREVIERLMDREPCVRSGIFAGDGSLHAAVLLNRCNVSPLQGLGAPVPAGDQLSVMPHIAGG